ncbi:MAG: NAD(P)/FAD-dependent oxidoreductase [Actinomycetota bacterium]
MSRADVVVVGAGPAGLSAAIELRRRGVGSVVVHEREQQAGGIPRHTDHLGYGMRDLHRVTTGPRYAASLVRRAERAGVEIRTGSTITSLDRIDAGAVVLATGVRERPRSARLVPGDRPTGVLTTGALQQFVTLHHQQVGRRAAVVGAEHVSFSAVLTLQHAGCEVAAMVTPLPRHQTYRPLWLATAGRHRVPVRAGVDVAEVVGRGRVEAVVLTDGSRIDCDTVVFTGDWVPDHELARTGGLAMLPGARSPVVDAALHTDRRGVFAIGNLVHPAETADVCALDGRHVAAAVLDWLTLQRWPDHVPPITTQAPIRWASHTARGITLRVDRFVTGRLRVSAGSRTLWTGRRRSFVPNRSITITDHAARATTGETLHVELVG